MQLPLSGQIVALCEHWGTDWLSPLRTSPADKRANAGPAGAVTRSRYISCRPCVRWTSGREPGRGARVVQKAVEFRSRIVLAVVTALAAVLYLGACAAERVGSPSYVTTGGVLIVVVGGHAGMPVARLTGRAAQARDLAAVHGARVAVVVADGAPYLSENVDLQGGGSRQDVNRAKIDTAVAAARARTSESDLVAALALAGQKLFTSPGPRTVVVEDSGLSTSGAVNFTQPGMLDADPTEVAGNLVDVGRIPDLAGAVVVFQGLGDTAKPQQPLDAVRRTQLQAIWAQVARQAGAVHVQFDSAVDKPVSPAGLPPMSAVSFAAPLACSGHKITLSGGTTAFQPLSPDFIDPDRAVAELRLVAHRIVTDGLISEVVGRYAAVGDRSLRQQLSKQRAQAVADALIGLGVPVSQLRVNGLGSDFPGYMPDRDAQGHLIPAAAARNRFVTLDLSKNGTAVSCG